MSCRRKISKKEKCLVAFDVDNGQLDAYASLAIDAKGEIVKYIRGARELKGKSVQARLRFSVDFLQSASTEVAYSANLELGRAAAEKYADFRKVAESLKPEPLVKAIQDANTPAAQLGTYAMLLGHCGKKEHAEALRKLIDGPPPPKGKRTPVASALAGYTLLEPEAGWRSIMNLARQKDESFLQRYAALQAMRWLGANRKDLVDEKKCVQGIALFLGVPDMADFAIEDLRIMTRWEYCDEILALTSKKGYNTPIMRKSVLRFALECPSPSAKARVQVERSSDPEWVAETEELLAEEKASQPKK